MSGNILLEMLATAVGVIGSFAMLPQVYIIFKRKSAHDISITTFGFLFVAGIIWVLYGFDTDSFPIVVSNLAGSIILAGIIVGWFLYGRTKPAEQN
jgi:MtN3 and saliva related transmembrane protein